MIGHAGARDDLASVDHMIAGAISGFVTRFLCQPFDVVKIRFQLQLDPINASHPTAKYTGVWRGTLCILREEGVTAFWKGHVPAQLLSVVYGGVQLSFGLLLHAGDRNTVQTRVTRTAQVLNATQCHMLDPPPNTPWILHRQHRAIANSERLTRDLRSASLLCAAINSLPRTYSATGHGGTASMQYFDNPFAFIVQLSFGLLLHAGDGNTVQTRVTRTVQVLNATQCHVLDPPPNTPWILHRQHRAIANSELLTRDLWSAPLLSAAINSLPRTYSATGHGGTASMRYFVNPFAFIVQFSSWEYLTRQCELSLGPERWQQWQNSANFTCGFASGCLSTAVAHPFDVIRTRLVAQMEPKTYRSVGQAVGCMWRQEGPRAFYRGLLPTLLQIGPLTGFQFAFYHFFVHVWELLLHPESHVTGISQSVACGAVSGFVSKTLVYPLDLIKKRLQVQGFTAQGVRFGRYTGFVHCIRCILTQEGVQGYFKGYLPSALKAMATTSCYFASYEAACEMLRLRHGLRAKDTATAEKSGD